MSNIGRLEPVAIRELWKHEERGFSAWLESNLDILSEAIGVKLSDPKRERLAGDFQCDLVCEGENGESVIIENQLEATNHDHLGKVLTYLTNLEAKAAIWISTAPRPEHIRTIAWLNETTPEDISFYLVRLDAYRIAGHDVAAPLLTVIVRPTAEAKSFGKEKKELAERHVLRLKFWEQLLDRARAKGILTHAQRSPSKDHWLTAGAGVQAGISFVYNIWMKDDAAVEVLMDTEDQEENKRIFDELYKKRAEIEKAFGSPLLWQRLDDKKSSRVRYEIHEGGLTEDSKWQKVQDAMIAAMDKLAKAVKPHLGRGAGN